MFDVAVTYLLDRRDGRDCVLLGEKRRGIGVGKVVAPGGKAEPGETPAQTAIREVAEEVGLVVETQALTQVGEISYPFLGREELSQRSFVFVAREFSGELNASRELDASWVALEDIPYERMWADARLWLPRALSGGFVRATISIGEDNEVLEASFHEGDADSLI